VTGDALGITTNANNVTRSAFFNTKQPTTAFTASFDYTRGAGSGNPADGFTFAIQNQAANALGTGGGGLGYGGLANATARALAVNIYNPNGRGISVRTDGTIPAGGTWTATTPVDIFNGTVRFNLTYDGTNLNVSLVQGANTFNLPAVAWNLAGVGADAWVGFTGATGGENAIQTISNFVFNVTGGPTPPPVSTYANAVSVADGAAVAVQPLLATSVTSFTMGALTVGAGSTLNVQADTGSLADTAYTLNFGATTFAGAGTINVANNGTGAGNVVLGALNDGGAARAITKTGAGTLTLGAAATSVVNGTSVNVSAGTLRVTNATALGTLANVTVATGANLSLGAAQTLGALNGAGNVALNGNALTVGAANNLASTFSGVIADGTGAAGLIKAGTGTLTLTGANTYTGATAVNAGTLMVTGSLANTAVTVNNGGTLAGTTTLSGPLAVGVGGALNPGASVGTLTVANDVTINGGTGSTWVVEFNSPTASDRLALTGAGNDLNFVVSDTNKLTISVQRIDGFAGTPDGVPVSYTIATKDPAGNFQLNGGAYTYDPNHYNFVAVNHFATNFSLAVSGNDLVLTFTPVPEPGTVLGVSAAALGLLALVRRRFRNLSTVPGGTAA
jgi:autotransporter-associated beta strand protein